jgi:hypothetical protein
MGYREERRADQAAERKEAREDKKLLIEGQLKAKQLAEEEKRKTAEFNRRQALQDKRQRQKEQQEKKARRAAKYGRIFGWLNQNPVTAFVGFVMVCSIVPAVLSQVAALSDAGVFMLLAGLLSAMLEGTAWALTFMGKQAEDAGRPAGKYRVATWSTALLASAVNYWHWNEALPKQQWVAVVFAASSLIAIYLWDMKTHGSHGKTKDERREEKERQEHAKKRRKDHKKVAELADKLLSASPFGSLDEEEAFAAAWRIEHGAEPGMTADLYGRSLNARMELGNVLKTGNSMSAQLLPTAVLTALHNPLRSHSTSTAQALPRVSLSGTGKGATTQAGIGLYGSQAASGKGRGRKALTGSGDTSRGRTETGRRGRSEEELKALLPKAHEIATDLVAEGKPISAASLAKRLQVRREDGMWLRDHVVEERKLRVVEGGEQALAKGA